MKTLHIYTDGACRGNPGPGAWGVLIVEGEVEQEYGGIAEETTNNRMELTAAIEALARVPPAHRVVLFTDSSYLQNGITSWLADWRRKNWRTANGKAVKNQDLWQRLDELVAALGRDQIQWKWVRGHSGVAGNERADQIANQHLDCLLQEQLHATGRS